MIDGFESWFAIEPAQVLSRRELTPAHSPLPIEGQQPRRRTVLHDFAKCDLILLARPLVIFRADPPIHAPATIRGAVPSEQGFQVGPERGRKRSNRDLHVAASLFRDRIWSSDFMLAYLPIMS